MRHAVGPDQAIDAELCVVHWIAKVATIAPGLNLPPFSVFHFVQQPLVHPVPDEATLQEQRHIYYILCIATLAYCKATIIACVSSICQSALPSS